MATNLDNLVRVDLFTNPRQAEAADLKTVLALAPGMPLDAGVVEFFTVQQFMDFVENGGFGNDTNNAFLALQMVKAALNQTGVRSIKLAGIGGEDGEKETRILFFGNLGQNPITSGKAVKILNPSAIEEGDVISITVQAKYYPYTFTATAGPSSTALDLLEDIANQMSGNFAQSFNVKFTDGDKLEIYAGSGGDVTEYYLFSVSENNPTNTIGIEISDLSSNFVNPGNSITIELNNPLEEFSENFNMYNGETIGDLLNLVQTDLTDQLENDPRFHSIEVNGNKAEIVIRWRDSAGDVGGFVTVSSDDFPFTLSFSNGGTGSSGLVDRIQQIRAIDDKWIALYMIGGFDDQGAEDRFEEIRLLSEYFETVKEKILVLDAIAFENPSQIDPAALFEAVKGREFTTVFAVVPSGDDDGESGFDISRNLHGLMTAAKVLAMDPDRRSSGWSWQTLDLADPSEVPQPLWLQIESWCNVYGSNRGINITARGKTTSGHPVHGTIAALWFKYRAGERITQAIARHVERFGKLPYDKNGIAVIASTVDGLLRDAETIGHAADGSTALNAPSIDEVAESDLTAERYPLSAGFRVEGSIVSVELGGVVSMTFDPAQIGVEVQ